LKITTDNSHTGTTKGDVKVMIRKALSWPQKTDIQGADATFRSRLFQVRAAATRKAQSVEEKTI